MVKATKRLACTIRRQLNPKRRLDNRECTMDLGGKMYSRGKQGEIGENATWSNALVNKAMKTTRLFQDVE